MLAPAQIMLVLVIALPSVYVLWLSLAHSTYGQAPAWVGLANYRAVLGDRYFWRALANTLLVVNVVVYVELAIALGMAVLFAGGVQARGLMVAIVMAPYAVSEVVAVAVWRYLVDPDIGPIMRGLSALGLPTLDWTVDRWSALTLVGLINMWMHLPFTFMLLYTARLAVPADLYEAARADGAAAWKEFRYVTLPALMPAILVAVLFRYIFGFRLFTEVWLLTQGGPVRSTEVLALYLYVTGFRYNDFGGAAAIGWLMLIASLLVSLIYLQRIYRSMTSHG